VKNVSGGECNLRLVKQSFAGFNRHSIKSVKWKDTMCQLDIFNLPVHVTYSNRKP
jgi:hypothetical protein